MKKIIITLPPTKLMIDALSLALFTSVIKSAASEEVISEHLQESFLISLN